MTISPIVFAFAVSGALILGLIIGVLLSAERVARLREWAALFPVLVRAIDETTGKGDEVRAAIKSQALSVGGEAAKKALDAAVDTVLRRPK